MINEQTKENKELQKWIKDYCTPNNRVFYDKVKKNDSLSQFISLKTICFRVVERCGFVTIDLEPHKEQ